MALRRQTASQRALDLDRRTLYRRQGRDATGNASAYIEVEEESDTPGKLGTTSQFDARNSVVGLNNRDNLDTADYWREQSGRDTRPGDVMRIVQFGSEEELWYVVRGAPKNRPSQRSRMSNWQTVFLAITPRLYLQAPAQAGYPAVYGPTYPPAAP